MMMSNLRFIRIKKIVLGELRPHKSSVWGGGFYPQTPNAYRLKLKSTGSREVRKISKGLEILFKKIQKHRKIIFSHVSEHCACFG